jgi:CHAT domain-containing protein/Tfp pilus assembly protein PilF
MSPVVMVLGLLLGQPVAGDDDEASLARKANDLNARAVALYQQGKVAEAVPLAQEALALYRQLYPPKRFPAGQPDVARSLNNLGELLQMRGKLAQAEPFLRQALAMCQKLYPVERYPAGHPDLAASLTNLGRLLLARGELAQAEPFYRQALAMWQKLYPNERFPAGHPHLATSLNNLGFLLETRGELAQAEPYYCQALAMDQKLYPKERFPAGHPHLATSLNNLGWLLKARGELARAESFLRQALAMRQKLYTKELFPAGHADLARSLNNLGLLLQDRGELAQAEPFYRQALAMRQKLYPQERFPAGHPDLAQSLNNLGLLLLARGELAQAEPFYRQALAMRQKLYPKERYPAGHPNLVNSLINLGFLLHAHGELAQAEPYYRQALAMQQRLLDNLLTGSAEAQALNYLAQQPLARDGYLSVTRDLPDTTAVAYATLWESRAALARWLAQRRLAALAGDEQTRALARDLLARRRELAALLLRPAGLDPKATEGVRQLTQDKEKLEQELARRLPAFEQLLRSSRRSPDELRRALPAGAVLIDLLHYVRFEHDPKRPGARGERWTPSYVAFVVSRDGPLRRVELGLAEPIDRAVTAWRAALMANPKSEIRSPKSERPEMALRRLVWEPLARHLPAGTQTIYVAPDGALTQLPWAALPGSQPGTILLKEHALAVVPHGQFLLEALADSRRQPPQVGRFLAVGGVAYDQAPAAGAPPEDLPRAARAASKVSWPALPGTARELDHILALAGERQVTVRRGTEASTTRLLHDLPEARWAHLATHGFFADASVRSALQLSEKDFERGRWGERVGVGARSPLVLSGLVLAGANRPIQDPEKEDGGILTAEAIAGLSLVELELAVLSACETGLGEVAGGEGVFGLQRAFHIAGARNVVASLWQVDDEATAALMGLFYHHLWTEKQPPLEALRQAQLALYYHPERIPLLARQRGPDFEKAARLPTAPQAAVRAPARLWAGFVLSGLGR